MLASSKVQVHQKGRNHMILLQTAKSYSQLTPQLWANPAKTTSTTQSQQSVRLIPQTRTASPRFSLDPDKETCSPKITSGTVSKTSQEEASIFFV